MLGGPVARNWEQLLGVEGNLQLTTSKNLEILQLYCGLSFCLQIWIFLQLSIQLLLETAAPTHTLFCFRDCAIFYPLDSEWGCLYLMLRVFNGTTFKISSCSVDSPLSPPSTSLFPFFFFFFSLWYKPKSGRLGYMPQGIDTILSSKSAFFLTHSTPPHHNSSKIDPWLPALPIVPWTRLYIDTTVGKSMGFGLRQEHESSLSRPLQCPYKDISGWKRDLWVDSHCFL